MEYPLKEHHHGFRPERSTTTALNIVTNHTKNLNQKNLATVLVALDLITTLAAVDQNLLLRAIPEATQLNSTKRWVASYLQGMFS